ncbi:MAG: TetR/AcrR family transcriptional regulator [Anaerolineae bacterium]|nr:TetR/AcrR family transcriptional regulator [Anaerolineae bacterium]
MKHKNEAAQTNKTRRRRNRADEILEIATKLFGQYGFQGTTLAMVAEVVGLTEPGVLHYFPSKVHLLQGVLAYRDARDFEKYAALIALKKENVAEFFAIMERFWGDNEKIPALIQLFVVLVGESISGEHPSHHFFVDRYRRQREIFTQQFRQISVRPDVDLDELASVIIAVMDGLHIQWLLDPDAVNLTATFSLFSKMIVPYLEG